MKKTHIFLIKMEPFTLILWVNHLPQKQFAQF